EPFFELLNPWFEIDSDEVFDESSQANWMDLRRAKTALIRQIENWNHGCKSWFCLVLPLRTKESLGGAKPIVERFVSVQDFYQDDFHSKAARLLPLLKHLRKISIWGWDNDAKSLTCDYCIDSDLQGTGRKYPDIKQGESSSVQGMINVQNKRDNTSHLVSYGGVETLLADQVFHEMKKDDRWPRTGTLDRETGALKYELEKADPHCAVTISSSPPTGTEPGEIHIEHAVFLPLSDDSVRIPSGINLSFSILLHGYFFLDRGRREIRQQIEFEDGIEGKWNAELRQRGLYSLVLKALENYAANTKASLIGMVSLTQQIQEQWEEFKTNKETICYSNQWVCLISNETPHETRWRLVDYENDVFRLPSPPMSEPSLPFEVFPALASICENFQVTFDSFPYLSKTPPKDVSECSSIMDLLLQSCEISVFTNQRHLEYFQSLFKDKYIISSNIRRKLTALLGEAISTFGLLELFKKAHVINSLFRTIVDFSVLLLPLRKKELKSQYYSLIKDIAVLETGFLILPCNLLQDLQNTVSLPLDIADFLLSCIHSDRDLDPEVKHVFSLNIIQNTDAEPDKKYFKFSKYQLFKVRDYTGDQEILTTWQEIKRICDTLILMISTILN
ncbi:MAG: hypothetical protein HOC09_35455, partial [Deltaproteobacteria bacterium]|nr:hypothetical protein [Deltaproteobacteria bacterium]